VETAKAAAGGRKFYLDPSRGREEREKSKPGFGDTADAKQIWRPSKRESEPDRGSYLFPLRSCLLRA